MCHPELEVLLRIMRWLHLFGELPRLRRDRASGLTMLQGRWVEPTTALRKEFEWLGLEHNESALTGLHWPAVVADKAFRGAVERRPWRC